ncbi:MAG: group II truncated hemoglobin [Rhodomicrobium sp.]
MNCPAPSTTAYDLIGGEAGIEAFVSRLYDIMASKPEAEYIWKWHPQDMDGVKARLAAFLSGWLGGPAVYPQNYGPPMMRRRHMPFPIGPKERDIWLDCARHALADTVADAALRELLDEALTAMAEHMRNRDERGLPGGGSCCGGGSCEH